MALPININELINGQTVEWERIEFKQGWNPEKIMHTICAFANDLNNWGGGYIIIGIKEKNGKPVLPPCGLNPDQIDAFQKKLIEICHKITPNYFPIAFPVVFHEKHILILWVPGGDNRPYKAPAKLSENSPQVFFVRRFSSTVKAGSEEEQQLFQLAAKIPYDDRINHHADLNDLNINLIQSFLKEIGSDLHSSLAQIPFSDLCIRMQIARGPEEYIKPLNVGLLLFNDQPERFFKGAKIEIVEYHDEIGDSFSEKIFTGPINMQLRDALRYLKNNVLKEEVRKIPGQPESVRFFNYPIAAIEEALANAVYHRSYEHLSPIEINIRSDRIEILSFPGPLPPVDNELLKKPVVVARAYRNRRIGDFLKEMQLTEGRSTGIPKIRRAMKKNGSPEPVFETDTDRTYFLTTLMIHPGATVSEQVSEQVIRILEFCKTPRKKQEILNHIGLSTVYMNYKRYIFPPVQKGLLSMTHPENPRHSNQRYVTTQLGLKLLKKQNE